MLYLIIGLLIFIVIAAILFKILKSIIKAVLFTLFIVAVLGIIFGVFVITDANTFKQRMGSSESTYLLIHENVAIQGVKINNAQNKSVVDPIGSEQLNYINEKLEENNFKEIKESNYKIIFIKTDEKTEDPEEFAEKREETFSSSTTLIKKIKTGEVKVYPENTMFTFLKYIPDQIISLVSKITNKG